MGFLARPEKNGKTTKKRFFPKKTFLKRNKNETDFLSWAKKRNENETVSRGRKKKTKRKNVFETVPSMATQTGGRDVTGDRRLERPDASRVLLVS